jgi:hypothetical protein
VLAVCLLTFMPLRFTSLQFISLLCGPFSFLAGRQVPRRIIGGK